MTETETIEGIKNDSKIPLSHSYINDNSDLNTILSKFSIEEYLVKEYEDKLYYLNIFSGLPTIFTVVAIFISTIIVSILSPEYYGSSLGLIEQQVQLFGRILVLLSFGIGFILWLIKQIIKSRINSMTISHDEAVYHNIVNAIKKYNSDDIKKAEQYLRSAYNLIDYKDKAVFNPKTEKYFIGFFERKVDNSDENGFDESFPIVSNALINELAGVRYIEYNKLGTDSTADELSDDESTSLSDIISEYINERINSPALRRVWPYIVALPIVILIYNFIGAVIAQIVSLFYIGMVEKLHNPEISE